MGKIVILDQFISFILNLLQKIKYCDLRSIFSDFDPSLFELYGVKPSGGELLAATTCVCKQTPAYRIRKAVTKVVKWEDDFKDPKSSKRWVTRVDCIEVS